MTDLPPAGSREGSSAALGHRLWCLIFGHRLAEWPMLSGDRCLNCGSPQVGRWHLG